MGQHYDRYGDSVLVSEGLNEVIIAFAKPEGKLKSAMIFDRKTARAIAEDILAMLGGSNNEGNNAC